MSNISVSSWSDSSAPASSRIHPVCWKRMRSRGSPCNTPLILQIEQTRYPKGHCVTDFTHILRNKKYCKHQTCDRCEINEKYLVREWHVAIAFTSSPSNGRSLRSMRTLSVVKTGSRSFSPGTTARSTWKSKPSSVSVPVLSKHT